MATNKVSIILPNYNSSEYLEETLKSIIGQSYEDWNLYIIDDNSNIETLKVLKKYENTKKIKIIYSKENKGAGYCRNLGIKYSYSQYLAFIDSDDLWMKDKLHEQINFMEKNNIKFSYTAYSAFNEKNERERSVYPPKQFNYQDFIKNTSIATSTMIIAREILDNIEFSDTKICEDYFFKCSLLKKIGRAYLLEKILTKYRIRKNSLQSNKLKNLYWIWKINREMNELGFLENLYSIFMISLNSLRKYGYK